MEDVFKKGIIRLADAYKQELNKYGLEVFLSCIGTGKSVRGVLNELYYILLKEGELEPIETLPVEEKQELWNEARRICKENKSEIIKAAKAIHAFGTYIQK